MPESQVPDGFVLTEEDLDEITEEDLEELEEIAEEYQEIVSDFNDDLDGILSEINQSEVYKKIGKELHVDVEYIYSYGERDDE